MKKKKVKRIDIEPFSKAIISVILTFYAGVERGEVERSLIEIVRGEARNLFKEKLTFLVEIFREKCRKINFTGISNCKTISETSLASI